MKRIFMLCGSLLPLVTGYAQTPEISVNPAYLSEDLYTGMESVQYLNVSNTGESLLTGYVTVVPTSNPDERNRAIQLDGSSDYCIVYNDASLQITDQLTLESWINFQEGGTGKPIILSKGRPVPNYELFLDTTSMSRKIGMTLDPMGTLMSQSTLTAGNWYHIAGTYDGSMMKIYINGELDATMTASGALTTGAYGLYFGKRDNNSAHRYKGVLDEIRIWHTARTQDQIRLSMNHEMTVIDDDMSGYWQFNELTGTKAYDLTAFQNDANLVGGVTRLPSNAPVINWLFTEPVTLSLDPGSSLSLEAFFNASGMNGGTYGGQIAFHTNDPVTPLFMVPVTITVTPAARVEVSENFLDFGEIFVGASKYLDFSVMNSGNTDLVVSSVYCVNTDYQADQPTLSLPPGDSTMVTVGYTPSSPGEDDAFLVLESNDPFEPTVQIHLSGTGILPPVLEFSPEEFEENLLSGRISEQTLTVSNSGESDLEFNLVQSAIQFFGYEDYVKAGNPGLYNVAQFTLEAWVYIGNYYTTGGLISLGDAESERFAVYYDYYNIIYIQDWESTGNEMVYLPFYGTGSWHHVALTHDGSQVRFYVDGQFSSGASLGSPDYFEQGYKLYFGARIGAQQYLDGRMDEVRIWNYARSEEEIFEDMLVNLSGSEDGLVGYWKFEELAGETALDQSVSHNHGVLTGDASRLEWDRLPGWLTLDPVNGTCPPGSSADIAVQMDARNLPGDEYRFDLTLRSNDPGKPIASIPVTLHVTDAPCISGDQDTLDFGVLYAGYDVSDTLDLWIMNTGSLDLLISEVAATPAEFTAFPMFAGIDPGESENFKVIFTPDEMGTYNGILTFTSNDPLTEEYHVVLTGKYLVPPAISSTPASFNDVLYSGKSVSHTLTLYNTGGSDLLWDISVEDAAFPTVTFTKQDYADWTLPENQDRITPNVYITRDVNHGIFNAKTETGYNYNISPEDTEWAYGYTSDLSPEDYRVWREAVGGHPPGMVNNPISLHLISEDLYFDMLFHSWTGGSNGGGFSYTRTYAMETWVRLSQASGTVPPGMSVEIQVTINAANLEGGSYHASINISSNDPADPLVTIPAYLEVIDAPSLQPDRDTLDFGDVFIGYPDTLHLTVENTGSMDLLIFNAESSPDEFSVTPPYASLDPGDMEIFTVSFAPVAEGDYLGSLVFNSNDPVLPEYTIVLKGRGLVAPVIAIVPDSLLAEVQEGQTGTESFTIYNLGGSDLNFNILPGSSGQNLALQFDGADDYMYVPNLIPIMNDPIDQFTFECWIYFNYLDNNPQQIIEAPICYGSAWLYIETINVNQLIYHIHDDNYNGHDLYSSALTAGNWMHLAFTFDGDFQKIYINGVEDVSINWSGTFTFVGGITFGKTPQFDGQYLDGFMDEARLWNDSKTSAEIQQNMNYLLAGNEPGLVGYWRFDEGSGLMADDLSPNGNDGQLYNGITWTNGSAPVGPPWLSVNPDSGTVPGNEYLAVNANFDAGGLDVGEYAATIHITSNDPVKPLFALPVRLTVTPYVGIGDPQIVSSQLTVRCYPNPFRGKSALDYELPVDGWVRLAVYDKLGQQLYILVDGKQSKGSHRVTLNAEGLPAGIYLYRLTVDSRSYTGKMVLLK